MKAILDTTVILHLFRKYVPAVSWLEDPQLYGVTAITWLEVLEGATSKAVLARSQAILDDFSIIYATTVDQQWAIEHIERFQFSHRIGMNDCLIASVANRLQIPLYTHNLKHMTPLIGSLAIQPYQ